MIQMSILGQQRVFVGLFSMAVLSAALPPFDTFEVNDRFGSKTDSLRSAEVSPLCARSCRRGAGGGAVHSNISGLLRASLEAEL